METNKKKERAVKRSSAQEKCEDGQRSRKSEKAGNRGGVDKTSDGSKSSRCAPCLRAGGNSLHPTRLSGRICSFWLHLGQDLNLGPPVNAPSSEPFGYQPHTGHSNLLSPPRPHHLIPTTQSPTNTATPSSAILFLSVSPKLHFFPISLYRPILRT